MSALLESLHKPSRSLLLVGIFLVIFGCILVVVHWKHTNRYDWRPIKLPMKVEAGVLNQGSFIAELDEIYEIELEFAENIHSEEIGNIALTMDSLSILDLDWQIRHGDEVVAEGNCKNYLYIRMIGQPFTRKILRKIVNLPQYQKVRGSKILLLRGVGKFSAKKGRRYEIRAHVGTTIANLSSLELLLGVRVNRKFAARQYQSTIGIAKVGFFFLFFAACLFSWIGISKVLKRPR